MRRLPLAGVALASLACLAFFDCTLTSVGIVPLNDLGPGTYKGVVGGLYPGGQNVRPAKHLAAGRAIASRDVKPRNLQGEVDLENGKIGLISVGMSTTHRVFDGQGARLAFKFRADSDPSKDPHVVIVDCAQEQQGAEQWADPDGEPWVELERRLREADITAPQVQAAWVELADIEPGRRFGEFPAHTDNLADEIVAVLQHLMKFFPNLRLAYLSSRTRSYIDDPLEISPEPFAYETAFAVRDVIARQRFGDPSLSFALPKPKSPWLSWGPYLWADGLTPRSDGLIWECRDTVPSSDTEVDFTHPSGQFGVPKVARQLFAFFKTEPTATPWYLRPGVTGSPPVSLLQVTPATGAAPLAVKLRARMSDDDGLVRGAAWDFGDGCYMMRAASVEKSYPAPGLYELHLTVTDNVGNTNQAVRTISVLPEGSTQWTDLGQGHAGSAGVPSLVGTGSLARRSDAGLILSGAAPSSPFLLVGVVAPFRGGALKPVPVRLATGLTSSAGGLSRNRRWPARLRPGQSIEFQAAIADAATPAGYSLSNVLRAEAP